MSLLEITRSFAVAFFLLLAAVRAVDLPSDLNLLDPATIADFEKPSDSKNRLKSSNSIEQKWQEYRQTFHKPVSQNRATEHEHMQNFIKNCQDAVEHNKQYLKHEASYFRNVNQFFDLDDADSKTAFRGLRLPQDKTQMQSLAMVAAQTVEPPKSLDWREKGVVTSVKNQHVCGSCYSFASVAAVESQYALKNNGSLLDLSEQQVVDCSSNYGCLGGYLENTFEYIKEHALTLEMDYPYVGRQRTCKTEKETSNHTIGLVSILKHRTYYHADQWEAPWWQFWSHWPWSNIEKKPKPDHEKTMKSLLVENGPLAVGLKSGLSSFLSYGGGIYDDARCGNEIDHVVLLVGYGSEKGKDYWIIKNSWGETWGEKGYMRIARNKAVCGIGIYVGVVNL